MKDLINKLTKASSAVYLACEESVADDISNILKEVIEVLTLDNTELMERLAAIEHERWADWQKYLHSKCTPMIQGGVLTHWGIT